MLKENKNFLKSLQKELLEDDTLGTRKPVIWGIMTEEEIASNCTDYDLIKLEINYHTYGDGEDIDSILEDLKNSTYEYLTDDEEFLKLFEEAKNYGWDFEDKMIYLVERIPNFIYDGCSLYYALRRHNLADGAYFLTKGEVEEHLKKYAGCYKEPYAYCMHLEDTPVLERLIKIVCTEDWD